MELWRARREPPPPAPVFGAMNNKSRKDRPQESPRRGPSPGQEETELHRRTDPPGVVGLGNEARPGLGTRANEPFPGEPDTEPANEAETPAEGEGGNVAQRQHSGVEPNDKPVPREPREQQPDTWDHEEERSTGVSGHLGST